MHSRFRPKSFTLTALIALLALLVLPGMLLAKPKPGVPGRGFRLMARATGAITINRIYCGLASTGEVCVDSLNSSTIGGGFWPKGSPQQYVFNSGLQAAGAVDSLSGFLWAGDTTGAFFFDPKGTTQHGEAVQPIWNSASVSDNANWPEAAKVPQGDAVADLFDINLQGRNSASQGDVWTIAWDGNPGLNAGRKHPLGIAVETRGLGWNYPTFNNDIVYFIYTFYNITSANPADYNAIRPGLRPIMQELGTRFQTLNNAAFSVTIPTGGYTINNFYANFAADMDVSSASSSNYSSVNLPFSLGYVYHDQFAGTDNNFRLPPDLGSAPFLNGYGFVGVKYLKSPLVDPDGAGPLPAAEAGIKLFSNTINGGAFGDPQNAQQLFRYLSGTISPPLGDGSCNYNPVTDRICYIKSDGHADARFFQSSGPFDLAPGGFGSIVVAYVFASALASPGCPAINCASVTAGDARRLSNSAQLASVAGANLVDSLTGFRGYTDVNADSIVQQGEFRTVKGSLLAKSLVAQTVFDNKFLLPASPAAPAFFLVPGDNQVTVVWRASVSEATGDFYFAAAGSPGTPAAPNLIYDPNYRQFDVEGYRVYRGRVDNPSTLTLLAQFDYADRVFTDYLGVVNPTPDCAPELGNQAGCPVTFSTPVPGNAYTVGQAYDITSPFVQVKLGDRTLLATGDAIILSADTAVTGTGSGGLAELTNSGVPFVYTDPNAKNNLRYFYSVTAFDVNSFQSGPSSLESARVTKAATPTHAATNYDPQVTTTVRVRGRGVLSDPAAALPTLDPVTGQFSGRMPAADGAALGLVGSFVKEIVAGSGQFFARLDSLKLGQVDLSGCCAAGGGPVNAHYYYTVSNGTTSTIIDQPLLQDLSAAQEGQGLFDGITVNNSFGGLYGGDNSYSLLAAIKPTLQAIGWAGGSGLGAALGAEGLTPADFSAAGTSGYRYDGFRWYDGANETFPNPTSLGACGVGTGACGLTNLANFNNAGAVTGAPLVYMPHSYRNFNREWRNVEAVLGGAVRAADVRVYWGAAGVVDSVIDLTHNVPLAFSDTLGAGWGILNNAAQTAAGSRDARTGTLTPADWMCVQPFRNMIPGSQGFFPCTSVAPFVLSKTAILGPTAVGVGNNQSTTNAGSIRNAANNNGGSGFSMYVAGTITFFGQMTVLPTATTWTLRTYSGAVFGGNGPNNSGNLGLYRFISKPRPLTAVGAEVVFNYTVTQNVNQTAAADLRRVHTVPDPYYITNAFERSPSGKIIKFVNLPNQAIVRIYSTSGVLVRVLEHNSAAFSGSLDWDVRNRNNQVVASGVYFYHIEAPSGERRVGRMTIVNFAQ